MKKRILDYKYEKCIKLFFKQRINVPNGYEEKSKDEFHYELFDGVIMHD
jgi:hypothetical protein